MREFLFRIEAVAGAWLLRLWRSTLHIQAKDQPPNNYPCVYALQHRDLLLLGIQRMYCKIAVLVSKSPDGELIARPVSHLGYIPVRGSSSRGGSEALKALIRLARDHSLAITPDGPKGPAGVIQPGVLQLALLAQIPIIPVVASSSRMWKLKSWDRFRLPKPWSKLTAHYGNEIRVGKREDFPAAETAIRQAWKELDKKLSR